MKRKLLMVFVAVIAIVSMFTLVACGGNDGNTTNGDTIKTSQLSVVKNINYTADGYKFTWDKVQNADSYNIKINSENINQNGIKNNEFSYYPKDITKPIKVQLQAVDSTGGYLKSNWSEEKTFTFQDQNALMSSIMNFAKGEVNGNLTGFISAYATTDLKGHKHITMHFTSKVEGKDKLSVVHGDITPDVDITSLNKIMQSNIETYFPEEYFVAVNSFDQTINSMEYLLQSDMNGTGLKSNYINKGYEISVISSYTALDEGDTAGKNFTIYSVVKAEKEDQIKYLHVTYDCRINDLSSSFEKNVTRGLLGNRYLNELAIKELSGDFAEAYKS